MSWLRTRRLREDRPTPLSSSTSGGPLNLDAIDGLRLALMIQSRFDQDWRPTATKPPLVFTHLGESVMVRRLRYNGPGESWSILLATATGDPYWHNLTIESCPALERIVNRRRRNSDTAPVRISA